MSLLAASEAALAACILPFLLDVEELTAILADLDRIRAEVKDVCHGIRVVSSRHWCSGNGDCHGSCYGALLCHWPAVSKHSETCALAGQRNVFEPSISVTCTAPCNRRDLALLSRSSSVLAVCIGRLRTPGAAVAEVAPALRRNTHLRLALNVAAVAMALERVEHSLFPRPISRAVCTEMLPVALGDKQGIVKCGAPLVDGSLRAPLAELSSRLAALRRDLAGVSMLVGMASHPCVVVPAASAAAAPPPPAALGGAVWPLPAWAAASTEQLGAEVVQDITYDEPAAQRDESLLWMQADEEWASFVERRIHGPPALQPASDTTTCPDAGCTEDDSGSDEAPESIYLLRFGSGDGALFRQRLLVGPEFRLCREALDDAGLDSVHPSQAIVLVKPTQYQDLSLALRGHELHPFHVVITESFEYLLEEVLAGIPCRRRPREKANTRRELECSTAEAAAERGAVDAAAGAVTEEELGGGSAAAGSGQSEPFVFVERRTFLCTAPRLRSAGSVVQSTTEAVHQVGTSMRLRSYFDHFRGDNPRRLVLA